MRTDRPNKMSLPATVLLLAMLALAVAAPWGCGDDSSTRPGDSGGDGNGDDSTGAGGERDSVEILFRVTVPADTPPDSSVYIAGDFQGWDPGADDFRLTRVSSQLHEIVLAFETGAFLQFKFTLGDWGRVEKGADGEEIPNRALTAAVSDTVELEVAGWAGGAGGSTITGNVSMLEVPGSLDGRRVWVYLPPGYDTKRDERYPVLYMLDGQNVFDHATSFAGEWEVDETCEALIAAGEMRPVIVVAVANGESRRTDEYTPWHDPERYGGGGGEEHLRAFADTLIPYVDANFRTLSGPENTAFAGSSLGGLMALYAAYAHGDTYGLIAALSPSIGWDGEHVVAFIDSLPPAASKIYVDMGTWEWGGPYDADQNGVPDAIDQLRAVRDKLAADGYVPGENLLVVEDEGGQHNEANWARRFPDALRFLFPPAEGG